MAFSVIEKLTQLRDVDLNADPVEDPDDGLVLKDGVVRRGSAPGGGGGGAYSALVGDGVEVTFDVTHGLGTRAVQVAGWDVTVDPEQQADIGVLIVDDDTVRIVAGEAPDEDGLRVVVLAEGGGSGGGAGPAEPRIHEARFGRIADPFAGNSPSANPGFHLRFITTMDVTITKITFFPQGSISNDLRIRLVELEGGMDGYGNPIIDLLHVGDWKTGTANVPFEEEMEVALPAHTFLGAIFEQASGTFQIRAQDAGDVSRAANHWYGLKADHDAIYGGASGPSAGIGDNLDRYGSTAMNTWIEYLA